MDNSSGLVWDACTLLNLVATRRADDILASLGCLCYVVDKVRADEVLYLRPLPEEDSQGTLIPVELAPLLDAGRLYEITLTPEEITTFVTFAAAMDDGEARSGAVALHRGLWLVTDDRVTIRHLNSLSPPVPTLTTPEWVKHWADTSCTATDIKDVLNRVQVCARYVPRRSHPLKKWWEDSIASD